MPICKAFLHFRQKSLRQLRCRERVQAQVNVTTTRVRNRTSLRPGLNRSSRSLVARSTQVSSIAGAMVFRDGRFRRRAKAQ